MRIALIAAASLLLAGCGGSEQDSRAGPVGDIQVEGEPIPVPGDPAHASYQLVRWSEMPNGHRESFTHRDGTSGTSYARREIDCSKRQFRYLGEGDTRQEAEEDLSNPGKMAELVPGSISSEVADFVCAK
jgi:hypothetical protein